jgi:chromate transporter
MSVLLQLFIAFFKIGAFTFGGGYAMLPLMQTEIITNHHWLTEKEFMDIIAIAEMTPGPVAINSATFIGFRIAGLFGAALATFGVILPSIIIVLIIAQLFTQFKNSPWTKAIITGIKPAVIGLIAIALISLGQTALIDFKSILIALAAFFLLVKFKLHPILVICLSAIGGLLFFP